MKMIMVLSLAIVAVLVAYESEANPIRTTSVADICSTKTSTVRNVSEKLKRQIYARDGVEYGVRPEECGSERYCYEADHRVSLELGGENSADNLMIQPYFGPCNAHHKDALENRLHRMICAGEIQVTEAQDLIYNHWIDGYKKYIDPAGCE